MVVVRSQVKDIVASVGVENVSADFADKLSEKAVTLIKDACYRAQQNGRKTVMAKDL